MNEPVIIAGTGRCGSSVVARICEDLGVDMGGPGDTDRESNPGGDYERADFKAAGEEYKAGEISAAEYRAFLEYQASEQDGPWGFKHPLAAEFFQQIISAFPGAAVIWCQRDLQDTAESFSRWYDRSVESCMITVKRRDTRLRSLLENRKYVLKLDMTERWDEDELADLVENYLTERGTL